MNDRDPQELGRLVYFARLLPHARDERELRAFVTECRLALLRLEPRQPEPLPHRISRELWPAQGERVDEDALAEGRSTVEAGAGFAVGEQARPVGGGVEEREE